MACNVSSVGVTVLASTRTRQRPSPMLRLPVGQRGPVGRGSPVALSARAARALAGDASLHTAVVAYWVRRNRWASRLPRGGQAAQASIFGVGAPEAFVIGVVALLVFGPKGLADAARGLGQTLRAFQPTIKELQEVSNEFKSTLQSEIGLDEIKRDLQMPPTTSKPAPPPPVSRDVPSELFVSDDDVVTEDMKAASAAAAWGDAAAPAPDAAVPTPAATTPAPAAADPATNTPAANPSSKAENAKEEPKSPSA